MKCRVLNCKSTNFSTSKCSFFSCPADDAVAGKWVEFCRQTKHFNLYTSVVCMKHFTDNDFQNLGQYKMGLATYLKLNRGAVPTIYNCDEPAAESQALEKINLSQQPKGTINDRIKK
ncbi:uncharacterized protein LOC129248841 [Anastrepha obliqua]|uniref:uncharacterized protein LOC129248841 n=1 Tax=Anastrepha obliqua TaxID=95512 RepID=UPI00240A7D3C|nr:uncharacterized protein LOC129248841 [Anastrepha obliqua]